MAQKAAQIMKAEDKQIALVLRGPMMAGNASMDRRTIGFLGNRLMEMGHTVRYFSSSEPGKLKGHLHSLRLILSMARDPKELDALSEVAKSGVPVINPPDAVRACANRTQMFKWAAENGIPVPDTQEIPVSRIIWNGYFFVLKKTDTHGTYGTTAVISPEQVSLPGEIPNITSESGLCKWRDELMENGVKTMLVQDFVAGEHRRVYGVGEELVFREAPSEEEKGEAAEFVHALASHFGLKIFGAEYIVDSSGKPTLTSLTDWPSFGGFREKMAGKIADFVESIAGGQ
jgi:hypothetical protein